METYSFWNAFKFFINPIYLCNLVATYSSSSSYKNVSYSRLICLQIQSLRTFSSFHIPNNSKFKMKQILQWSLWLFQQNLLNHILNKTRNKGETWSLKVEKWKCWKSPVVCFQTYCMWLYKKYVLLVDIVWCKV